MSVPYQGTELFMNVQIQEIREDQRKLQRVVTQVRGGQWVLAALFVVLACCLFYCTVHIKTVSETLTATHKSVGELSESFRESSESFTKEMKEINSSLITSLRNLTETMVELTKELQEMKASPYKLQNQTKNFSVADVKDSRAFSDSLSAEFADESVFARLMEGLVTNIQHVFEWMYHEKNKLVVDAAEYISKIEKTKLFDAAQYIFATIMVVFAYKEICRRVQNSNAHDQAGNALGLADFTYFTRSALLVAAAKFYDLGNYSALTETTTAEDSSDRKKEFESIIAVASVHALFVLVSDVLAQKNYVENAFDAIVSVVLRVFALFLGTAAWFCLVFPFANISTVTSETQRATLAFALAYFMSSLTVLPGTHAASAQALVRTRNARKQQQQDRRRRAATFTTTVGAIFMPALCVIAFAKLVKRNYLRVIKERIFRSDFDAFFRATLIGSVLFASVGGLLAPLDLSTEWHKYPTLSVGLAIIGHILGTVLTTVFAWLDRTLRRR